MSTAHNFIDTGYGKSFVKLLHVKRDGNFHSIREFEVSIQLSLDSKKDYIYGDNEDIVATDSQKNTVYILAKKHGVTSPEDFALLLCNHFVNNYPQVVKARVIIEAKPWQRIERSGKKHNHAFVSSPVQTRFCTIIKKKGERPLIESGLKDFRVLKTTQSSFVKFVDDEFRSLPDAPERIFSTIIFSRWDYHTTTDLDFDYAWNTIREIILMNFCGPPKTGIPSPSVQNTLYQTQTEILNRVPQVSSIEMEMPNKHYFEADLSKFPRVGVKDNKDVYIGTDKPSGTIRLMMGRNFAKL